MANQNFNQADAIKQAIVRKYTQPIYCVFCGKPILMCSTNSDGTFNNNVEWELEHNAHYTCYIKEMSKREWN